MRIVNYLAVTPDNCVPGISICWAVDEVIGLWMSLRKLKGANFQVAKTTRC